MPNVRFGLVALGGLLMLGQASPLPGQERNSSGNTPQIGQDVDGDVRLAQVVVDGEALFSVRGVTARPAERRAHDIADRIRAIAADASIGANQVVLEEHSGATWIMVAGRRIMALIDEDAALEQTNRTTLAELYRIRIAEVIVAYRHRRQRDVLWLHALYALIATVGLLVFGILGRRLVRVVRSSVEQHYRAKLEGLQDRAYQMVKADQVWRVLMGLINVAGAAGGIVVLYFYLNYGLSLFPWTLGLAKRLFDIAMNPIRTLGLGLIGFIPNLVFLAVLILVTRYALRVIRMLFNSVAAGTVVLDGFDSDWALPTYRLIRILIIGFAVVVAYPYIPGSDSEAFKGVSLFAGVIFSLGSSSLIGNFIAGYSMTYRKAFKVGDRVKIGQHIGVVERTRLLVTHLRTMKNEELVVPNSNILSNEVINYSSLAQCRGLILHTTVGIGYETPWRQIEAMLIEAAARTPGFKTEPPPFVHQTALGDFCVTYEINVFCASADDMEERYTQLHRNILDIFNEYGVQIMTPAYESDPAEPKVVSKDQWYASPACRTNNLEHELTGRSSR
jgi:small-conductance mechanosensitive channel